jgi:histidinol-phosphate aminotransferase
MLSRADLLPDLDRQGSAKELLYAGLRALHLDPLPSDCNFFLVPIAGLAARIEPAPGQLAPAAIVRRALLARGFLVRDCTSFGLPDYIRISIRTLSECQQLLAAFKDVVLSPVRNF